MDNNSVFGTKWLESQLTESLGASEVSNLVRLSGGANRETWSFDAKVQESHHSLICLLYTSPSPRDRTRSRMPSSA